MLTVENFNVRIVNTGDTYGRNDCLVNDKETLVEFYDKRYEHEIGRGQFVSRYYASTLLDSGCSHGLALDCGVPEWTVSADGMEQVLTYIKKEQS